ncbi:carbohydrate porin [Acetobacter indonesiensis]|uniref:carbohydrate porin n=1 Tax=Acetobacter indonesiensis TaxID=104101 RepID=UPI0039E9F087
MKAIFASKAVYLLFLIVIQMSLVSWSYAQVLSTAQGNASKTAETVIVKPAAKSFWDNSRLPVFLQDNVPASSPQKEQTGMAASALGSAWREVRIVPKDDRILGNLGGFRTNMERHGFAFTLTYLTETLGDVVGGRKRGMTYTHQIVMGTDLDFEKMLGWKGTSFHMLGIQRAGRNVATDYMGVTPLTQPQEDYGAGGNVLYKLVYMYMEQSLFDKKLIIDFGRMPANMKFGTSYLGCYALNMITCAHPSGLSNVTKWRSWPFSQWGIMARVNPANRLYAQAGLYEVSPTEGGRAGFNFSFAQNGFVIPLELGWEPSLGPDKLSGHYKLGGYIDTSDHLDPFTSIDGRPKLVSHLPGKTERQRGAWYVGADQMVYRYGPAANQGIILYGLAGWNMGASLPNQSQYTLGIISQGMFPSRITDAISFFWTRQTVNRKITRQQEMQADMGLSLLNGVAAPQSNFQVLELTYTAFIARGMKLLPDLQYIINPDANKVYPNALLAGFRFVAQF